MSSFGQLLARRRDASALLVLLIVASGYALASVDLFVVNVALPKIAQDFGSAGLGDLSWVLNAYAIVYAALLVVFGRLADRFPREYGFLLGVAVFTLASALCAAANGTLALVTFRIVQAAGAALMTPTSLSMVLATSSREARDNNVRAWTAIGGLMAALGPVVGGLLVTISWRWVFVVNIPLGLAVLAVGWVRLPHVRGERVPYPDVLGAALITAGVALLTLGLVKGDDWGWDSTQTIGVLVASVAIIGSFVLHCLHHRNPLLDRDLFRRRSFSGASVVVTLYSVAFGAFLLSLVLWDQNVWHWSALQTGLAIAPGPFLVLPTALLLTERLIVRAGPGVVIAMGASLFTSGAVWFALFAGPKPDYFADIFPGLVAAGVGVGLALTTMIASATSELPPENFATGSAVVSMLRQVGLAIGVAVLIAVLGTPHSAAAVLDAFDRSWLVIGAFAAASALASLAVIGVRRAAPHSAPAAAIVPIDGRESHKETAMKEFLVEFDLNVPDGTPQTEVEQRTRAEASAAARLVDQGHLVRLWRRDDRPAIGIYAADSRAELDRLMQALPLADWMQITITALEPHANDPVPVAR
jgi:muconolactone delta-isomerase